MVAGGDGGGVVVGGRKGTTIFFKPREGHMELHRRVLPFFISFPPVYCHFLSFSLFFSPLASGK